MVTAHVRHILVAAGGGGTQPIRPAYLGKYYTRHHRKGGAVNVNDEGVVELPCTCQAAARSARPGGPSAVSGPGKGRGGRLLYLLCSLKFEP